MPLEHLELQLQRSAAEEHDVETFIETLHDPGSPNFHRWLTAAEFGRRFGAAGADIITIREWLESHGFRVGPVYPGGMVVDFSGTGSLSTIHPQPPAGGAPCSDPGVSSNGDDVEATLDAEWSSAAAPDAAILVAACANSATVECLGLDALRRCGRRNRFQRHFQRYHSDLLEREPRGAVGHRKVLCSRDGMERHVRQRPDGRILWLRA